MIYTKISSFIVNRRNMRYYFFLGLIMFLLILSNVSSANMVFDDPVSLEGATVTGARNITKIRAFYDSNLDQFIVMHNQRENYLKVATFDQTDFTTRTDGWDTLSTGMTGYSFDMVKYNDTHGLLFTDQGPNYRNVSYISLNGLSISAFSNNATTNPTTCEYDNESFSGASHGGFLFTNNCNSWYLDDLFQFKVLSTIPSSYNQSRDSFLFYDSDYNLFHLILSERAGSDYTLGAIYDLMFDVDWNYKGVSALADATDTSTFGKIFLSSPSFAKKGDAYYLSYEIGNWRLNASQNSTEIRFMAFTFNPSTYHFYQIFSEKYTPPNVGNGINTSVAPFLYYDDYHQHFWLFYAVYGQQDATLKGVYAQKETSDCECSAWHNTTCIEGTSYIKRVRVCYPSACADEESSLWNFTCNQTMGGLLHMPKTQHISRTGQCDTGWHDPLVDGQIRCDASLPIPENCTNIVVNATLSPIAEQTAPWIFGYQDEKWDWILCNPLTSCTDGNYLCEQTNKTIMLSASTYSAGETATAGFVIIGGQCKQNRRFMFDYGWSKYRLLGTLTYVCDKYCGGLTCRTLGLVDQKIYQYEDCTYNESSAETCAEGCNDGQCVSKPIPQMTGDPFTIMQNMAESSFPPIILFGLSVGIAGAGMIVGTYQTKSYQIGLGIGLLICGIFWKLRWLDSWILLLWGLTVALLISKEIAGKIKGD